MSDMKTVDLDQFNIIFAGIRLQGFADGDSVTIDFDGPAFIFTMGGDGESIRSKNYNRSAIMKYRGMQSSSVNDLLSALHNIDLNKPNGAGVAPFLLEDGQGTTVLKSGQAYIEAPPNIVISPTPQPREWTIRLAKVTGNWGGN